MWGGHGARPPTGSVWTVSSRRGWPRQGFLTILRTLLRPYKRRGGCPGQSNGHRRRPGYSLVLPLRQEPTHLLLVQEAQPRLLKGAGPQSAWSNAWLCWAPSMVLS